MFDIDGNGFDASENQDSGENPQHNGKPRECVKSLLKMV